MFSDKVVLITGASSGIGASTAFYFASQNAFLALTGRNITNLQTTSAKCEEISKRKPLIITGDVTKIEDLTKIINETIEKFKKLDVLINNAGITCMSGIEGSIEDLDLIYETNLKSIYVLTQLSLPHLITTKGNIVNISSVAGKRPIPSLLGYSMMKAALDQFTRCLALELGPKQIRVNSVNPGLIDTNIFMRAGMTTDDYSDYLEMSKERYPLGRFGTGEDVAKMIGFLAGNDAGFITGETICVDGGKQFALSPL